MTAVDDLDAHQRRSAIENYRTIADVEDLDIRYVEAQAKTGSRYAVVATRLPRAAAEREGGRVLVTVLQPWQDSWVFQGGDYVTERYVAEHLTDGRYWSGNLHSGDLAALTMAVAQAVGGEAGVH